MNNKTSFPPVLEGGKSEIRVPVWVLLRVLSWVQTADFLRCPHMEEGAQELCGGPFIEALILFSRASSSFDPPKALPLDTNHLDFSGFAQTC